MFAPVSAENILSVTSCGISTLHSAGTEPMCSCAQSTSVLSDSVTAWAVAHQAPLSLGFFRREHWSGFPEDAAFPCTALHRSPCLHPWGPSPPPGACDLGEKGLRVRDHLLLWASLPVSVSQLITSVSRGDPRRCDLQGLDSRREGRAKRRRGRAAVGTVRTPADCP